MAFEDHPPMFTRPKLNLKKGPALVNRASVEPKYARQNWIGPKGGGDVYMVEG